MPLLGVQTGTAPWTKARHLDARSGVLRLLQGELAVVATAPNVTEHRTPTSPSSLRYVGSGDATTCLVIAIRAAGCLLMAHIDNGASCAQIVHRAETLGGTVTDGGVSKTCDVWMLGAFLDVRGTSEKIVTSCLREMAESAQVIFRIQSTCTLDENTDRETGGPKFTGLAFDLLLGEAFPVVFKGTCAGALRRRALLWIRDGVAGESCNEIWDAQGGGVLILKSLPCIFSDQLLEFLNYTLTIGDTQLMAVTSTSPEYEEQTYCADVRETILFLLHNRNRVLPEEIFKWNTLSLLWERVREREEVEMVLSAGEEKIVSTTNSDG
jgi:Protein N-terminal asparagine amidohydrolase